MSYEAQRTTAAQCWNATKVKVVQFQQNSAKKQESSVGIYNLIFISGLLGFSL